MTDLLYAKPPAQMMVVTGASNHLAYECWRACPKSSLLRSGTPPDPVNPVYRVAKQKAPVQAVNTSGRWLKTHTATVITAKGEKTVKIRETATVWSAGSNENYDKLTGQRVGAPGRCRLLLESIT